MKIEHVIEGLQILQKHFADKHCVSTKHDLLYAGYKAYGLHAPSLSQAEHDRLQELGWFVDTNTDRWVCRP